MPSFKVEGEGQEKGHSVQKINCQFFDSRHSPEDPMSISPLVPEITA